MLSKLRPRSIYDGAAALSLFIALGGTAYAVAANSVGTTQLKNGAVTNPKLAKDAVGGGKVIDKSLTGADINDSTLPGSEPWRDLINETSHECYTSNNVGRTFCANASLSQPDASTWGERPNGSGEDYNRVGYYRDREGIVRLKGLAQCQDYGGSTFCNNARFTIFYVPPGYRPSHWTFLPTVAGQNPGIGDHFLTIYPDGRVRADGSPAVKDYVSLDGISFRCGPVGQDGCK
jgi:hypothetical protein